MQRIAGPHVQLKCDFMPFDKIDIESITEERRKSIAIENARVRPISRLEETLGEGLLADRVLDILNGSH